MMWSFIDRASRKLWNARGPSAVHHEGLGKKCSLDNWTMKGLEKEGTGDEAEGCLDRILETKTPYLLLLMETQVLVCIH